MTQEPKRDVDTTEFKRLPADPPRKPISQERRDVIHRRFPSTVHLAPITSTAAASWVTAFDEDPELLGRCLRDFLKEERSAPGHRGPRYGLDRVRDGPALDRLRGLDPARHPYSLLPFTEALGLLVGRRSIRHVASTLGWPSTKVQRLRAGQMTPTMPDLEHIASTFGHHPAYFVEYRTWAIGEVLASVLGRQPEVSIGFYERLWQYASRPPKARTEEQE